MKPYKEIYEIVKSTLSEYRFFHSQCVANRCVELASIYQVDKDAARLVGIVHDIAKEMPPEEKVKYCKENHLGIDEIEKENVGLLHGKIAADIAKKQFGFSEDLCSAICYHTTGKENMSLLDKILYVADFIEVHRDKADHLPELRKLAFEDLDEALYQILKGTLNYLKRKGSPIDPMTKETFEYYHSLRSLSDRKELV